MFKSVLAVLAVLSIGACSPQGNFILSEAGLAEIAEHQRKYLYVQEFSYPRDFDRVSYDELVSNPQTLMECVAAMLDKPVPETAPEILVKSLGQIEAAQPRAHAVYARPLEQIWVREGWEGHADLLAHEMAHHVAKHDPYRTLREEEDRAEWVERRVLAHCSNEGSKPPPSLYYKKV